MKWFTRKDVDGFFGLFDSHGQLFHNFVDRHFWQAQWQFALAYAVMAAFFLYAHARQRRQAG